MGAGRPENGRSREPFQHVFRASLGASFLRLPPADAMNALLRRHRRQLAFFLKLGACCAAWYLVYNLWLLPEGSLDAAVARSVASITGALLGGVGFEAVADGRSVLAKGVRGVFIADGCNGLATMGLFVGFVVAYPGRWLRRALFLPLGALAIYLANVGRIFSMVLFQKHWPAGFDIMHTYGMTSLFYAVVFGLWVLWAHYGSPSSGSAPAQTKRPAGGVAASDGSA